MTCATCGHDRESHPHLSCHHIDFIGGMRRFCPCSVFVEKRVAREDSVLAVSIPIRNAPMVDGGMVHPLSSVVTAIPYGSRGFVAYEESGMVCLAAVSRRAYDDVHACAHTLPPEAARELARNLITIAERAEKSMPRMPAIGGGA